MIKRICIKISDDEYYDDAQLLVRSFFSDASVNRCCEGEVFDFRDACLWMGDSDVLYLDADFFVAFVPSCGLSRGEAHDVFKKALYEALVGFSGRSLPWGFLTGVRPAKRAMELINEFGEDEKNLIISEFKRKYLTSEKKAELAFTVAENERRVLAAHGISQKNGKYQGFSIYVGIPFCPSTCLYCSFTSVPIGKCNSAFVNDYIDALCREIERGGEIYAKARKSAFDSKGFKASSVYIGGGTPTSLEPEQIGRIIDCVKSNFSINMDSEFCVEAGRPDSINEEKLICLKERGVNRISVNPQSMNQKTLDLIGRAHTTDDCLRAFELARKVGFDNINTDIILGLPGEDKKDVEHTVSEIKRLHPDSLTVHSLALKRASRLNINAEDYKDEKRVNSRELMDMTFELAKSLGMNPYYMYRQQNMTGNFENTGYAKPGKESLYNIVIMEEVQDILAFGAGASSKFLMGNNRFERAVNVKDIRNYIQRTDEMCQRKEELLKFK